MLPYSQDRRCAKYVFHNIYTVPAKQPDFYSANNGLAEKQKLIIARLRSEYCLLLLPKGHNSYENDPKCHGIDSRNIRLANSFCWHSCFARRRPRLYRLSAAADIQHSHGFYVYFGRYYGVEKLETRHVC